ncbi:unnamed protein product [Euphydryas editha]|nr:unnamed protein product [Euphydryas editha]
MNNGQTLSEQESAERLAHFFHSVYSPEPAGLDVLAYSATRGAARVYLTRLDVAELRRALARLPLKRSVGPDGIPSFIFKDCRFALEEPLLHVFNVCLASTTFPDRWKLTRVVSVPKRLGGPEPGDYRPVALLCTPAKVFDSAIQHSLHEQVRPQLSDAQHGYRPGRETTGNLLQLISQVVPALDAGGQVDIAHFDF